MFHPFQIISILLNDCLFTLHYPVPGTISAGTGAGTG